MFLLMFLIIAVAFAVLVCGESRTCEYNRQINRLVRESVRNERQRERTLRRSYAYSHIGYTWKGNGGGDTP